MYILAFHPIVFQQSYWSDPELCITITIADMDMNRQMFVTEKEETDSKNPE